VLRGPEAGGEGVWADSAYRSDAQERRLSEGGHRSQIHERAYRDAPLGAEQRARNTAKSRVRARVEHVFGQMENGMGGMCLRSVGLARAKVGGCGVDESGLQSSARRVADPQQGVSVHPGDGTGSWGGLRRRGKRVWEARFRQEEGGEQGVNCPISLHGTLQRE